jgi:hypothetical protein
LIKKSRRDQPAPSHGNSSFFRAVALTENLGMAASMAQSGIAELTFKGRKNPA